MLKKAAFVRLPFIFRIKILTCRSGDNPIGAGEGGDRDVVDMAEGDFVLSSKESSLAPVSTIIDEDSSSAQLSNDVEQLLSSDMPSEDAAIVDVVLSTTKGAVEIVNGSDFFFGSLSILSTANDFDVSITILLSFSSLDL